MIDINIEIKKTDTLCTCIILKKSLLCYCRLTLLLVVVTFIGQFDNIYYREVQSFRCRCLNIVVKITNEL